jgi:CRISPR-associated protein (TIGR02710 family)
VKGLILTVGTSVDPIAFAIRGADDLQAVCLLHTPGSQRIADQAKQVAEERGARVRMFSFADSADSVSLLIRDACEGFRWMTAEQLVEPSKVTLDLTGGRKWMSAAGAMAASVLGLNLQYVEAKNESGSPVAGSETAISMVNPFERTGLHEFRLGQQLASRFNFSAASKAFSSMDPEFSDEVELFQGLGEIYGALHQWDQFQFLESSLLARFEGGMQKVGRSLRGRRGAAGADFLNSIGEVANRIEAMTHGPKPSPEILGELLGAAQRRIQIGSLDDGVARLYRLTEGIAQYLLIQEKPAEPPPEDGGVKTGDGLAKGWEKLLELNHPVAQELYGNGNLKNFKLQKIVDARNDSVLAHGWAAVRPETATKFVDLVEKTFNGAFPGITPIEVPNLPNLLV